MVWLLPRTRLLEPLLHGGVLLTDRGQVRGDRKHARARTHTLVPLAENQKEATMVSPSTRRGQFRPDSGLESHSP